MRGRWLVNGRKRGVLGSEPATYVLDANVLIDFLDIDLEIFLLAANHLGYVLVSSQVVIDEVDGLTVKRCTEVGIQCIDPTMKHLAIAQESHPALSFHDLLCFALTRERDGICVTNDKKLREHCTEHGMNVLWGLQMILDLVELRAIEKGRALQVAREICEENPTLGEVILQSFSEKIRKIGGS